MTAKHITERSEGIVEEARAVVEVRVRKLNIDKCCSVIAELALACCTEANNVVEVARGSSDTASECQNYILNIVGKDDWSAAHLSSSGRASTSRSVHGAVLI